MLKDASTLSALVRCGNLACRQRNVALTGRLAGARSIRGQIDGRGGQGVFSTFFLLRAPMPPRYGRYEAFLKR
jgi:hypothetical protein